MNDTDLPARPGYRWVILLIATLAQACACFFVQGIGPIAAYIQNDLHLSNAQIGWELGISEKTVRNHLSHLYDKLDLHSRAAAIAYAHASGLHG